MNTKRLLALLLTLCMVFSLAVPGVAFAEDEETALLVEEGTPAETQDETPVIEEQPEETTQTPVVEEIIEENEQPAESVTDENEQPAENTDEPQTPEQPDENEQPALPSLEAREEAQLGDPTYVAQIGETGYATLAAAFAAVQDGETITLLDDLTQDDGVEFNKAGVSAEFDLNGHTFTVNNGSNINNRAIKITNGTLEVCNGSIVAVGSGTTSSNGAGCYGAFRVEANGVLNAHDLTLTNSRPWGLNVKVLGGVATLEDVIINSSYGGGIEVTETTLGGHSKVGKATLTNCTFTQSDYFDHCSTALSVSGGSELTVNSGSYEGEYALYVFSSGGVIKVNGGTFKGLGNKDRAAIVAAIDTKTYPNYTGGLEISGGTFTGTYNITDPAYLSITGGTYNNDPSDYVADGYEAVDNGNGTWIVQAKAANVAQIGETGYPTLAEAVAAVADNETATIQMIDDSVETAAVKNDKGAYTSSLNHVMFVKAGQNITLDLNGHTVSYVTDALPLYFIVNEGTLTVKDTSANANGKITLTAGVDGSYGKETTTIYNHGGTLNLQSGIIENASNGGAAYAVDNSSNSWNTGSDLISTFNMTGGQLSGAKTDNTLRVYQNTSTTSIKWTNQVNISGGTLDNGIFVDTVVYNPTTAYTGDNIEIDINISDNAIVNGLIDLKLRHHFNTSLDITGGTFTNAALRVRKGDNWNANVSEKADSLVNISGGQFSFANGKAFGSNSNYNGTDWTELVKPYYVSGGLFNVDLNNYAIQFPEGKTGVESGNVTYPYTVGDVAPTYVAQIGTTGYETLAAAIAAAQTGDTVKLLAATNGGYDISGKNITLDLNDLTLTLGPSIGSTNTETSGIRVLAGAGLTIQNGTLYVSNIQRSDKTGYAGYVKVALANYGTMVIDDVTLTQDASDSRLIWAVSNRGDLTIKGNTTIPNGTNPYTEADNPTLTRAAINMTPYDYTNTNATLTIADSTVNVGNIVINDENNPKEHGSTTDRTISLNISAGNYGTITKTHDYAGVTATKSITGGTYNNDPTAYVAEGYKAVDNGNGTWTVTAKTLNDLVEETVDEETASGAPTTATIEVNTANNTIGTGNSQVTAEVGTTVTVEKPATVENTNVAVSKITYTPAGGSTTATAYVVTDGTNTAAITNTNVTVAANAVTNNASVDALVNVPAVLAAVVADNENSVTAANITSMSLDLVKNQVYANASAPTNIIEFTQASGTKVFDVHPVATITTTDGNNTTTTYNASDNLAQNASFTFKLRVQDGVAGQRVTLTHYATDGTPKNESWVKYTDANGDVELTLTSFSYITANIENVTWAGTGTSNDPFIIDSYEKLEKLSYNVNNGEHYANTYFALGENIDMSGNTNWTPIGDGGRSGSSTTGNYFAGNFNGRTYTISGLTVNDTTVFADEDAADTKAFGLFGTVQGGTIQNVTLETPSVSSTSNNTGAVVGFLNGGSVSYCHVVNGGTVHSLEGAGGIVGRVINGGTVEHCDNSASVTAENRIAGGIVGIMYRGTGSSITYSTNTGDVSGTECVGGIVGLATAANVTGNNNSGDVTLTGSTKSFAGGIVGEYRNSGTVTNNTNSGDVSGGTNMGGIIGSTTNRGSTAGTTSTVTVQYNDATAGTPQTIVGGAETTVTETLSNNVPIAITFNANGGSGSMDVFYAGSTTATLPANTFTAPTGKEFDKWNTQADGNGTDYLAGATVPPTDTTLYAQWKDAVTPATNEVYFDYLQSDFGNFYEFTISIRVPDLTYIPELNLGGFRALSASDQATYDASDVVAYTVSTYEENYYDYKIKVFAQYLDTPIYFKVMHNGEEVTVGKNAADNGDTQIMRVLDGYGTGYSIGDYVRVMALTNTKYVALANSIGTYAAAVQGLK